MIFTERNITVRKGLSTIDEPVILYRGDFEVELRFTIMETKFRFKSGVNLVDSEKASHAQLALLAPDGSNVFTEIGKCENGTAIFVLTKEMIDELSEVGKYSFQIRLFDYYQESRISIPPVEFGIEVREPVASEDHTNAVDQAMVGYSIAKTSVLDEPVPETFDNNGQYNKTDWETGDRISEGKLNKIEDAIDQINQNEMTDAEALNKQMNSNFNVLQTQIDNLIIESGNTDAEVIQARGEETTLNNRLNKIEDASAERFDEITSQLEHIMDQISINSYKSASIHYGVTISYNLDVEKTYIDKIAKVGCNHLIIAIDIGQYLDTDNDMRELSDVFMTSLIVPITTYAQSKNLEIAWKLHCHSDDNGNYVNPSNIKTWFDNWKLRVQKASMYAISNNVYVLGVCNELHLMTINSNKSYWSEVVNVAKSEGIQKTLIAITSKEAKDYKNRCLDVFDIIGFNTYPSITLTSSDENLTSLDYYKSFYNDAQNTKYSKYYEDIKKEYGKELWVTEVGMCPTEEALFRTYLFNFSSGAILNEDIQAKYYEAILTELYNNKNLNCVSLWGVNEYIDPAKPYASFTFLNRKAESIVKKYWGGAN